MALAINCAYCGERIQNTHSKSLGEELLCERCSKVLGIMPVDYTELLGSEKVKLKEKENNA